MVSAFPATFNHTFIFSLKAKKYTTDIVYNVNNRKLKSLELEGDMKSTPSKQMVLERCMYAVFGRI